jgi:thiosulfate reductase cytochrome b subunit
MAAKKSRERKFTTEPKRTVPFFVTFCHWSMVGLLGLNVLTGMRLGWGFIDSPLGGPHGAWAAILHAVAPQGTLLGVEVIRWHLMCAWLLLLNAGIYIVYLCCSGASRRLRVTRHELAPLIGAIPAGSFWHNKRALWSANLLVYWIAFAAIGLLVVTGVALYRVDGGLHHMLGGYRTVRVLHALAAYLWLPYVVLHVALQWRFGTLGGIFHPRFDRRHFKAGCMGLAMALPVVGGVYLWDQVPTTLTAKLVPMSMPLPVLDGDPNDPVWSCADEVTVTTVKGLNTPHDQVDIALKALHDGQHIYFRLQWADPNVSRKRFPLLKTPQGWKVLQTGLERHDEDVYYEDKLAIYLTDVRHGGCASTCHLGKGAAGSTKGVHYTAGEIGDVWHWKSVRTDPMGELTEEPGYMDDQHFGPPDPRPAHPRQRYTGGYYPDPAPAGGYRLNFVAREPDKPLAQGYVRPLKLPPLLTTGHATPDPTTSEQGIVWWIHESQGLPYMEEADRYPVGTLIPNILIAPLQGDRADVRAKGAWHQGRWTVEVRRVLDTKSPYDVALTPGKPVSLSIAAFNRTQTRHSEHLKPIRLLLQRTRTPCAAVLSGSASLQGFSAPHPTGDLLYGRVSDMIDIQEVLGDTNIHENL